MRSWFSEQFIPSNPLGWIALVGILIVAMLIVARERKDKNEIDSNPGFTCGTIIQHERAGHSGRLTRYEYYVKGVRYIAVAGGGQAIWGLHPYAFLHRLDLSS